MERRREIQELQAHYQATQNNKAAYEKMIDELTQIENDKQWDAREQ